jgi:hypothetical protein
MRILIASFLALLTTSSARAEGCPKEPVEEDGGTHWCYSMGKQGNVHLWKPAGYDPGDAVLIVYLHGHDIDASKRGQAHYLDWAWDAHGLPERFAESGLKALYVAAEGPLNDGQKVKWTSLEALTDSIRDKGGIRPPSKVAVLAHSAGIFTAMGFLKDERVVHVVALDALYQDAPDRLETWFEDSGAHRLTLVGADSVHWRASKLGKKLKCDVARTAGPYPRGDRCVVAVDPDLDHMQVVTGSRDIIARVLARMRAK